MGLRHHGLDGPTFQMREKIFAIGDDFWIEDSDGRRIYKVNGKAVRLRDSFILEDARGNELSKLREKVLSVRDKSRVALVCMVLRMHGRRVLPLQLERSPEEVQTHERRLAALERDHHLVDAALGGEQLREVRLVYVGRHPEPAAGVELVLGQEEAVLAVEVADGAGGLGHHVEGPRCRQCRLRGPFRWWSVGSASRRSRGLSSMTRTPGMPPGHRAASRAHS